MPLKLSISYILIGPNSNYSMLKAEHLSKAVCFLQEKSYVFRYQSYHIVLLSRMLLIWSLVKPHFSNISSEFSPIKLAED